MAVEGKVFHFQAVDRACSSREIFAATRDVAAVWYSQSEHAVAGVCESGVDHEVCANSRDWPNVREFDSE
jgi:hypothetical protein